MRIELKKFGEILTSRPAGREAYLALLAYLTKDLKEDEIVEIDFADVKVLTPSWADEFVTQIAKKFKHVKFLNISNPTVSATLRTLRKYSEMKA
jgi:hypothetical protein